jgi:glycosyltransferase involved in cell wall biosynthesis
MKQSEAVLSVVVPVYNEAVGLPHFHTSLLDVLQRGPLDYQVVYVDDGSLDDSTAVILQFAVADSRIRLIRLTRNFGKEIATTAGLHAATGNAILMIDADGQHPVDAIPKFIERWQAGAKVVVGVPSNRKAALSKRLGSRLFNGAFRRLTGTAIDPNATDFRLIDRSVQVEFNRMSERNRITRGLIDWLGHKREYVSYQENSRIAGTATYSFRKLFKLAIDSAISLSTSPLYLVSYIGAIVLPVATLLGLGMVVNACLRDPMGLHATGGAYLIVLLLWLVGVLLVSQGIIGLYLSHIHTETQGRPLYIIDTEHSSHLK